MYLSLIVRAFCLISPQSALDAASCAAASPAWKLHGLRGFVGTESPAAVGAAYPEGHVAYHLRGGLHYLSRQDWLFYMDFVRRHKGETV